MTEFQITQLLDSSILAIDDMKGSIDISPEYQRPGSVWNRKKKQLFIDSLLNRYDIPKLYFHKLSGPKKARDYQYAIIDGRQRLETIWEFVDGRFPLADDFEYFEDPNVDARNMTYLELSQRYPKIVTRLNSRTLTIMVVQADDLDVIEDMFSRLNEAVPLNAAEKRNAFGGPLPIITRRLVTDRFFTNKIKVSAQRYRHHDIAAKFLHLENTEDIVDTKKATLDAFFEDARDRKSPDTRFNVLEASVLKNLETMSKIFADKDSLLTSSGLVVVYYVLVSRAHRLPYPIQVDRSDLVKFDLLREENRKKFEHDMDGVDRRLIEFDELSQSSNDGASIRERYEILRKYLDEQLMQCADER